MVDFSLSRPLEIGERLSQEEVDDVFSANFGFQFKGISPRTRDEGKFIILNSNAGEIYDDQHRDDGTLIYEGEGEKKKGDQSSDYANGALIETASELRPIYLFTSEEGVDEYEYEGLVDVQNYRYVSDGSRMVYKFELQKLGIASWEEYQEMAEEVIEPDEDSPLLTDNDPGYTESRRRVRSTTFAREVKQQYDHTCAVCGQSRRTPEGNPEVEAAHIYPKSEGGDDDVRNGIALCKLHHWAFDSGWFSLTDDRTVIVNEWSECEPPEEVASLAGNKLLEPKNLDKVPDQKVIEGHRELHGFKS